MTFKVKHEEFDDLSELEQDLASDNGCGKEDAMYLRVVLDGKTVLLENDAMEPEDVTFYRDLSWIKGAIEMAYNLGIKAT